MRLFRKMSFYFKRTKKYGCTRYIRNQYGFFYMAWYVWWSCFIVTRYHIKKKNHKGLLLRYFEVPGWRRYCLCLAWLWSLVTKTSWLPTLIVHDNAASLHTPNSFYHHHKRETTTSRNACSGRLLSEILLNLVPTGIKIKKTHTGCLGYSYIWC